MGPPALVGARAVVPGRRAALVHCAVRVGRRQTRPRGVRPVLHDSCWPAAPRGLGRRQSMGARCPAQALARRAASRSRSNTVRRRRRPRHVRKHARRYGLLSRTVGHGALADERRTVSTTGAAVVAGRMLVVAGVSAPCWGSTPTLARLWANALVSDQVLTTPCIAGSTLVVLGRTALWVVDVLGGGSPQPTSCRRPEAASPVLVGNKFLFADLARGSMWSAERGDRDGGAARGTRLRDGGLGACIDGWVFLGSKSGRVVGSGTVMILRERYELTPFGQGGQGRVFLAKDLRIAGKEWVAKQVPLNGGDPAKPSRGPGPQSVA